MNGGSRIVGLRPDVDALMVDTAPEELRAPEAEWSDDRMPLPGDAPFEDDGDAPPIPLRWFRPALAIFAVLLWVGGMLWLTLPVLERPMPPVDLVQFIAAMCVPPALIAILYLITMRTSRAEARRFGATAHAMRAEAASLERVVATLARKLESNRAELARQTTDLLALGDGATERLQAVSNGMADQARNIEKSSRLLGDSAGDAERTLAGVIAALPQARDETEQWTAALASAATMADARAAALDTQLSALIAHARTADTTATSSAERLATAIAAMDSSSRTGAERIETVSAGMTATVDGLLDRTATAIDDARKGITAQGEAMHALLASKQEMIDRTGRDATTALAERIATIDTSVQQLAASLTAHQAANAALMAEVTAGIARADTDLAGFHANGMRRTQDLNASIAALTSGSAAMADAMQSGEAVTRGVIATVEGLLTALDAAAREIDETLPDAFGRLDDRMTISRQLVAETKPALLALVTAAESTHDAVEAVVGVVAGQRSALAATTDALHAALDAGQHQVGSIQQVIDSTISSTRRFAEDAAPQLVDALLRIRDTAATAADQARVTLTSVIPDAVRRLEREAADALGRAAESSVAPQLAALTASSEMALDAAAAASDRLARNLRSIEESTVAIESRIDDDRAAREKSDSDNFARRVSLLIEALNSAAIDITKAVSTEVSDSAWAAYLKGDRGVFTRRAVRLLDAGQTREILALYDGDERFRDQVNRYIHDFEAMLRQILALRDGSPLGVTLLSSDMGKLYVMLAQAIERLRG